MDKPTDNGQPTFLSLFSGIGGLDLGLERAGWRCVGQVEIDPYCQRVLAKHWPDVPRWADIKELNPDELPRADLICGGFPCQPVSVAGQGLVQEDPRWLWPEAARLVRHLRPNWILLENVTGLLARGGMGDVLGELAASGYDAEWDVIPAASVGAPHLRERVFVVAYPAGDGCRDWLAGERERQHDPLGRREQPRGYGQDGAVADAHGPGRGPRARLGWPRPTIERDGWWSAEPNVGRVVDGISTRMDRDRVRRLGNAIVPQVAELIGRGILDAYQKVA